MDRIRIAVNVPLDAAVAAGRSEYGDAEVVLTDVDVARLSGEARVMLAPMREGPRKGLVGVLQNGWPAALTVTKADAEHVVFEIERLAAAVLERAKKTAAENEETIVQALARPVEDWIVQGWSTTLPQVSSNGPCGMYLSPAQYEDERVRARLAEVRAVLPEHVERYEREQAAAREAQLAEEREREKKMAVWRAACAAYVIRWVPDYARAAREGKDVCSVALSASRDACVDMLDSVGLEPVEVYDDPKEHSRPKEHAYQIFDKVMAEMARARAMDIAAAGVGIVSDFVVRIVRGDTCPVKGCTEGVRTLVEVTLRYDDGSERQVRVYADTAPRHEPHDEPHDDETAED